MRLTRQVHKPMLPMLNMAAMIDVVFLLLIYFLVTMVFIDPQFSLLSQLPNIGERQAKAEMLDFEPVRIVLARGVDGGGLPDLTIDGGLVADFVELEAQLKQRREIADLPVIIRGDDGLAFDYFVRALDACHGAGLFNVAFSAGSGSGTGGGP